MKARLLLSLLALSVSPAIHAAPASKPNIILVMPDDAGFGDYSCLTKPKNECQLQPTQKQQS